jgi:parallel beta-helix repeat protein
MDSMKLISNIITRCGYEWNQQQGTGISIGGLTRNTYVHDNTIDQTFLYGIFDLGEGHNRIENNKVTNSGFLEVDPSINKDTLLAQIKKNTGYTLAIEGNMLKNTFSLPFNICISPF